MTVKVHVHSPKNAMMVNFGDGLIHAAALGGGVGMMPPTRAFCTRFHANALLTMS